MDPSTIFAAWATGPSDEAPSDPPAEPPRRIPSPADVGLGGGGAPLATRDAASAFDDLGRQLDRLPEPNIGAWARPKGSI